MGKKYSFWGNAAYHWKEQLQREPKMAAAVVALTALSAALPLWNARLPQRILQGLEEHLALTAYVRGIVALAGILAVGNMLKAALTGYVRRMQGPFEDEYNLRILKKRLRVDYEMLESEAFNRDAHAVYDSLYRSRSVIRDSSVIWQQFLTAIAGVLLYGTILFRRSRMLAALVAATAVVTFLFKRKADAFERRLRPRADEAVRNMRYVEEQAYDFSAGKDIRLYRLEGWLFSILRRERARGEGCVRQWETGFLGVNLWDAFMGFARDAVAYLYLIYEITQGRMAVSDFVWYTAVVASCQQACSLLLENRDLLERLHFDYARLRSFLEMDEHPVFAGKDRIEKKEPVCIRLENVGFTYPGSNAPTLKNINLTIRAGEKVALVGLNGAGKSTLVKILCGLYHPTEGRIYVDEKPAEEYEPASYFRMIAAVFQDVRLLPLTIAQNVAAQDGETFDRGRVIGCLKAAGLWETVSRLPKREDTSLGNGILDGGIELSGGQRQKLWMARAFYKDAPFLVLDEPTAALDPLAEQEIYERYAELSAQKTSLFISHRLASTQFCDRIILLADGSIAEEGSHSQLLEKGGSYARLFAVQGRNYREEDGET
ncbi:MAG: ABC transporter ATP-binding protein [Eubacteriales bacterium]|nr:ABC transporter ATP-binding protein [Eubacteriales bacterium]